MLIFQFDILLFNLNFPDLRILTEIITQAREVKDEEDETDESKIIRYDFEI